MKSSFSCLLLFHAKLRRNLPVCHALAIIGSAALLWLSFARGCRCFVQMYRSSRIRRKGLLHPPQKQMKMHATLLRYVQQESAIEAQNSGHINIGGNQTLSYILIINLSFNSIIRLSSAILNCSFLTQQTEQFFRKQPARMRPRADASTQIRMSSPPPRAESHGMPRLA